MTGVKGRGPSILGTLARFRARPRGMLFGTLGNPRPVGTRLSGAEIRAVRERLKPTLIRLNQQRQTWFEATENQLRLKMGAAALAGLVLGWFGMGSVMIGLALMVGGAFFAFLMSVTKTDETARAQTKHAVLAEMADELLGLISVPPEARTEALSKEVVERWRLLPPVRVITVDDRLVGERDGFDVAVSRVGFQFGGSSNVELTQGDGMVFVVVEITDPGARGADEDTFTIVLGTDAPAMLRGAPRLTYGLAEAESGDAGFDARYSVFGDPAPLSKEVRAAFAPLEAVARCDKTGTRDVSAGGGLRPVVLMRPGHLVVMTPVPVFDGALEPPPYWEPLEPGTLIAAFASDLAILDDHLAAAMALRAARRP
ncbi:hypothetical protein [Pelagibacterium montanilacus]|uniref:hypothetical protein n=1 Tax=Pelagibacterium montanilacus TaxID=2185280 RepID=UPI000F8EC571|nr:hypothetical protein [Pelagibacterium montanilacus]